MGDMSEYWKDIKPHLKERRKQHVRKMGNSATKNIETLGFEFTHYPNNHQFAINTHNGIIDYWGTTGTWIERKTKKRGKGIRSLRKYINQEDSE
ncbi:hypothetical protein [Enterococcus faecium]|uniref:hypothetical protein n=1 Tax=Enterococcus faecium TaxID=1352 RepID=UPI00111F781B|nr:hypothetical protein [Enterococcus faecium]TNX46091.1 hypothetical protein FIU36_13305 [Enterococcus faecium]TVM06746.1 hypothetical protein FCN52_10225 [Enterococcus faecium]HEA4129432.1 hypothetical protein [Enterococcus faecium]HEA4132334.1 hypothetical protein [Enterococcus faecium]